MAVILAAEDFAMGSAKRYSVSGNNQKGMGV